VSHPLGDSLEGTEFTERERRKASILFALRGRKKDRGLHREARIEEPKGGRGKWLKV
jgi:hypothetical protein